MILKLMRMIRNAINGLDALFSPFAAKKQQRDPKVPLFNAPTRQRRDGGP
jgi:hypothetical protein